jgi:deazaflavin-dependent oxidoreductase (nitroreductase family)
MPLTGDYVPSPKPWVADQVALYESTGGQEGSTLQGKPVVILTTIGRRTGKVRKVAVMRVEHDGTYAVVASLGGAPQHPVWYHNLLADPEATVQDGPNVYDVRAREVHGEEKATWWARAVEAWPDYATYQEKTSREIPVVVLERV